jgi:uncharacterized protein YndB with AHSA1/START domain
MPARNAAESDMAAHTQDREISATRVFDAPRDVVWMMFTEPKHIANWWGPNGFTNTIHDMDVRPGGSWNFIMHGPDGRDYVNKVVYREVVKPERLVYDHVSGPTHHVRITFAALGAEKTEVTFRMTFETAELRNKVATEFGAVDGLQQNLQRLVTELEGQRSSTGRAFVISRTFDAPRDLMWRLWTDSDHLGRWFGPKGVKIFHSRNELRPGGVYHYGLENPDGSRYWGKWIYREIVEPERLVFVVSFSDENRGLVRHHMAPVWPLQWLSTVTFEPEGAGKTKVTVQWIPLNATAEERKAFDEGNASMNQGWSGTFDQLDQHIARVRG